MASPSAQVAAAKAAAAKKTTPPPSYAITMQQNPYTSENPFLNYFGSSDPTAKSLLLQTLNRNLLATQTPGLPTNDFVYLYTLLRGKGYSKGKTNLSLGIIDNEDKAALDKLLTVAIPSGLDPIGYLNQPSVGNTAKGPKVQDTTTTFSKQIQSALQYKDAGDARVAYNNAYFTAFGQFPAPELDSSFRDAWNAKVKTELAPTTTAGKTEYHTNYDKKSKPVIDKKTGLQAKDKFGDLKYSKILTNATGQKTYTPVVTGQSVTPGEGFTAIEQEQFLSEYLVKNNPSTKWDIKTLGGQAKTTYDDLVATISANYGTPQDLSTLGPVIAQALGNADPKVVAEVIKKFKDDQRKAAGIKYMGLADYTNAGEDANKYVAPLIKTTSNYLESDITIDDPLMKKFLNFQGSDGKYRLPNDYEIEQELKKDSRYQKTSRAKNDVVNLFQSLKDQIGR